MTSRYVIAALAIAVSSRCHAAIDTVIPLPKEIRAVGEPVQLDSDYARKPPKPVVNIEPWCEQCTGKKRKLQQELPNLEDGEHRVSTELSLESQRDDT